MAFPNYVLTRTATVGGAAILESSDLLRIRLTISASKSLIHAESGYRFKNLSFVTTSEPGTDAVAVLPQTGMSGWKDARTGDIIDVTAEGSYTHQYMALVEYLDADGNSKGIAPDTIGPFVVPAGDGAIDLDKLIPVGSSSGESISFPAYWDDLVQQAQASAAAAQAALLDSADFIGSEIARSGSPAEQALLPKIVEVAVASPELNAATSGLIAAALESFQGGAGLTDEAGVLLSSRLASGIGDMDIALLGDSTGNDVGDWFRRALALIAQAHPTLRVIYTLWDHASQAYPDFTTLQAGDYASTGGLIVNDTFNRVGELVGSGDPAWAGTPGWTTDGAKAIAGSAGTKTVDGGAIADHMQVAFRAVTIDSTNGAAAKEHRFFTKYVSASHHVFLSVLVPPSGGATSILYKRINGTAGVLQGPLAIGLTASSINTFDVQIDVDGESVSALVNGVSFAGTLSSTDVLTLAAGTSVGFAAQSTAAALPSFTIGGVELSTPVASEGQTLRVYNGSYPGAKLSYQSTRLPAMLPESPDVVIVSSSHNYGTDAPSIYIPLVEQLASDIAALHPDALLVASSQNPQFPGTQTTTAGIEAHLARLTELRIAANRHRWGYVPVLEGFRALPDGGASYIASDGVHPFVNSAPPNGSIFWSEVFMDWLNRHFV